MSGFTLGSISVRGYNVLGRRREEHERRREECVVATLFAFSLE